MGKLLVGWSEVSITPEGKKIRLAGQFAERISEYVESPVTVTALAIEADGEQMIFCSCDLVKIGENLQQRIRDAVAKAEPEIPTEKIIISAIHTHTSHLYDYEVKGPSGTREILDSYLPPEKQYRAVVASDVPDLMTPHESLLFIVERATQAIVEAWHNRTDARYATGFDRAVVGMCRRVCYSDGSAKMWGDSNSAAFTELEGGDDGLPF